MVAPWSAGRDRSSAVAYTDARASFFWHELSAHDAPVISVDDGGSSGTHTRIHPPSCLYSLSACIPIACSSEHLADIWVACLSSACAALSATAPTARITHRTADRAARSRELIYSIRALLVFAMRRYRVPCPRRSTHRVWIDNQIAGCKLCKHSTHRVWIHHQIAGCERADGACLVWCHVLVWSRVLIWCRACSSGAACARPVTRALDW
jgi:hypothetical protein